MLVFEQRSGEYTATLADLGHSISFNEDDDRAHMPRSTPWEAPNHSLRIKYRFSDMVGMEVYSFGMVCMWLLFHERLLERGIALERVGKAKDLDYLRNLKNGRGMYEVARDLTQKTPGISTDQIRGLIKFFGLCLAPNHTDRGSNIGSLLPLLSNKSIAPKAAVFSTTVTTVSSKRPHESFSVRSVMIQKAWT